MGAEQPHVEVLQGPRSAGQRGPIRGVVFTGLPVGICRGWDWGVGVIEGLWGLYEQGDGVIEGLWGLYEQVDGVLVGSVGVCRAFVQRPPPKWGELCGD